MARLLNKLNVVAQKRLVTKPWDKMLFDMRMELGKAITKTCPYNIQRILSALDIKKIIGRVLIILKCLLKTFIVGTH